MFFHTLATSAHENVPGEIDLTFTNLKNILKDATKLKVETLVEKCNSFLEREVTTANCIDLLVSAQDLEFSEVEIKARDFFLVSELTTLKFISFLLKVVKLEVYPSFVKFM